MKRNNIDKIPVFVFHKGNPSYLRHTIAQAEKNNEVHLLGDKTNKTVCKIWDEAEKYVAEDYRVFEKVFVQMSDYSLEFDLNCFKRFFIMRDYMEKHHIKKMLFADSDLLLYTNVSEYYMEHPCKTSLSIPERQDRFRWTAQAHCSFWTIEYLSDFLKFVIDTYENNLDKLKNKYYYHIEHALKGGVCDMTLLYLWSCSKDQILNVSKNLDGSAFDHCISDSGNYLDGEYRFNKVLQTKKVTFDGVTPYCITVKGEKVKMLALHCQGSAKALIPYLLEGKIETFSTYRERYMEVFRRVVKKIGGG